MNAASTTRPMGYWMIAAAALLWNLLGLAMWYLQVSMTPEAIAALPVEQRQVYEAAPPWVDIAFGVAVFGGVLGALGLLLRRRWAVALFALSLLGLLVQLVSVFTMTPALAVHGPSVLVRSGVLVLIALFLLWYSRRAAARRWIA